MSVQNQQDEVKIVGMDISTGLREMNDQQYFQLDCTLHLPLLVDYLPSPLLASVHAPCAYRPPLSGTRSPARRGSQQRLLRFDA